MSTYLNPDAIQDKSIESSKFKEEYLLSSNSIKYNEEHISHRRSADGKEIKNDTATIKNIYGNSVVLNQLNKTDYIWNTDAVNGTVTDNGDEIIHISKGNTEFSYVYSSNITNNVIPNKYGHKIICIANIPTGYYISGTKSAATDSTIDNGCIFTVSDTGLETPVVIFRKNDGTNFVVDETIIIKNLLLIDLTHMFGADNEPTTVDEFYRRLPKGVDLNAYNAGEIIDGKYGSIKTTGSNQWDEQWEVGNINENTGANETSTTQIRSKNYIPIIPSTDYYGCLPQGLYISCYDKHKNFLGLYGGGSGWVNGNSIISASNFLDGTAYIRFEVTSTYGTTYNNDICINISDESKNGTYEPYVESTCDLSWLSKYFPNGMCSAGEARDEIRFNSTTQKWEAVQRIGVVDLGSLTYGLGSTNNSSYQRFQVTIPDIKAVSAPNLVGNILCAKYITKTADNTWASTKGISVDTYGIVAIYDEAYNNDVATFKTAMQGVMLNYELAEPIVTEITEIINPTYTVSSFGTEELITDSQSSQIKANIAYDYDIKLKTNSVNFDSIKNDINVINDSINDINSHIQRNNEIWYTSSDDNIVTPYSTTVFGANIINNTYSNGKGVIKFDGDVTDIGDMAFYYCSSLTSITIPDSVTSIGDSAFRDCTSLTSITIPDGVTSIASGAFGGCTLTSVTIPNSVTSIGDETFYGCSSLTSITIPNSVTSIGCDAFVGCSSLTSVTIPDGVTDIRDNAFYECTSLTSITIPNSVTSIMDGAFYGCSSLTSVTIPNSVTSIASGAFEGCTSLTSITIPDSVTSIGEYVFGGCTSLTSITIPDSVTQIELGVFENCTSLTSVYCKPTTPPTGGLYMFNDNASEFKIYVPINSVNVYKSAEYWSDYADDIVGYVFLDEDSAHVLITYVELKWLRDNNMLTPGQQYRITDYMTTTQQPLTRSAGHPFDIIVTADTENTLNEKARACLHEENIDMSLYDQAFDNGNGLEVNYIEDIEYYSKVYRLYENSEGEQYLINFNKHHKIIDSSLDYRYGIFPDYIRPTSDDSWEWGVDAACLGFEYNPNKVADLSYFANNKIESWEIWYSLDNDMTRFAWATDYLSPDSNSKMIMAALNTVDDDVEHFIFIRNNEYDEDNKCAWVIDGSWCMHCAEPESTFRFYVRDHSEELDDSVIIYTENENPSIGDVFISSDENPWRIISPSVGTGVIYRMIDEFGNDCPYDFKNIQYIRDVSFSDGLLNFNKQNQIRCLYTFTGQSRHVDLDIMIGENWSDYLLDGSLESPHLHYFDSYDVNTFNNNIINSYKNMWDDYSIDEEDNKKHSGLLTLNNIILTGHWDELNSSEDPTYCYYINCCYNNTFGHNCYNNTFGYGCHGNTFGHTCFNNIFGNNCYRNTFGHNCYHNTFAEECYHNTFGIECEDNTFKMSCSNNIFGDSCNSNTFGNGCYANTFGFTCGANTFGDSCIFNTFGDECQWNTFGNTHKTGGRYYRYFALGAGTKYVIFKNTDTASYNNCVQNYRTAQGLQGTSSNKLTVDVTRGLTYENKIARNSSGEIVIYCEADLNDKIGDINTILESIINE